MKFRNHVIFFIVTYSNIFPKATHITVRHYLLPLHLGTGLFCPEQGAPFLWQAMCPQGYSQTDSTVSWVPLTGHGSFLSPQRRCPGWAWIWPFRELGKHLKECWSGLLKFHTHFVSLLQEGLSSGLLFLFWFIQFPWLGCGNFFPVSTALALLHL